jgi:hypothetical protein
MMAVTVHQQVDTAFDGLFETSGNPVEVQPAIHPPAQEPRASGRDPYRCPVPLAASLALGASTTGQLTTNVSDVARFTVTILFSANGGQTRSAIVAS